MRTLFSGIILGALLALTFSAADAQKLSNTLPPPTVRPAIDGILSAFETHPLVALANSNIAQADDFYAALVRDPRFAREVGNVVVEFGGAAHQDTIDRYLNGQDVSYSDLRKVWTDVVGYDFPADIGHINFFAQVRAVNLSLPPEQRIHVWLGEPVINWSKIKTKADFSLSLGNAARMQRR